MKFGFGVLNLSPAQFWSMSMREFNAAVTSRMGEAGNTMSQNDLAKLSARYPDKNGHLSKENS